MVDGLDENNVNGGNVDVGRLLTGTPGTVQVEQTLGTFPAHFPGGMAINQLDNLVVSDTYNGTLDNLGATEPWNNVAADTACNMPGFPNTYYVDVAFDDVQNEIWANNFNLPIPPGSTDAVSNAYPIVNGMPCVTPGQSGGPTAMGASGKFWEGIAVSPNTGV
jgi:hypothetical protein